MGSNYQTIEKAAAITTGGVTHGLLNPEQARKFLQQTFEATPLGPMVRKEIRTAKTGEIDKIGISARLLRRKVENMDANGDGSAPTRDPATGQVTGYRAAPTFGQVTYSTTAVRLPWEITEETLRENIEGQSFEGIVTNLMTTQVGVDQEDLCLNGDESIASSDPDHNFLYINNGWIKQIENGGHVIDRTASGGSMSLDVFYDALRAIPNKYNNGKLCWLMSPHRRQEWERYILTQAVTAGGIVTDKRVENPVAIPSVEVPTMPDDKILLVDPKNLIVVNTYDVKIRKTTEGVQAIMQDKRFYVIHFDFDPIIEELDACGIITNLAAL